MKKLKHITKTCEELYEKHGAGAVYTYCNEYIDAHPNSNVSYKQCTACDAKTPHFCTECLICGENELRPTKTKSPADCPHCGSKNTRLDYDFPDTMSDCDDCGCDFITETLEIVLNPDKL